MQPAVALESSTPQQLIPNQIEREIVIDAPVEVVWHVVTEPEQIVRWFSDGVEFELRAGARGRMSFKSSDAYDLQIEDVDPPHRFAFRWARADELRPRGHGTLLVEFTLIEEGGKTRVRVAESGFEHVDWSDEEIRKYAESHTAGWETILGRLRDYIASAPSR